MSAKNNRSSWKIRMEHSRAEKRVMVSAGRLKVSRLQSVLSIVERSGTYGSVGLN